MVRPQHEYGNVLRSITQQEFLQIYEPAGGVGGLPQLLLLIRMNSLSQTRHLT